MMDTHLRGLYPFLHGERQDPKAMESALLESVRQKADQSLDVKRAFFESRAGDVLAAAGAIAGAYRARGKLMTMGNGGSSCDAAHVAVEFQHPVTAGRPALPALNLVADTAMMTAVGNDVGYRHVFVRPLIAHATPGDALLGLSTSGNSENLMAAFAKAREMGLVTIGLAGMDGGQMARSAKLDHCLVVETDSIHRIQETHVAIFHILWDLVHALLADTRGSVSVST
jgi:D-sedoheptulose 7-phosphate isomerase